MVRGKSTIFRMILNLIEPTEGEIKFNNENIDQKVLDKFGYLPEEGSLLPTFSVIDICEYYGAAEPPVRCGVSHLSGLTEPLHRIVILPVLGQVHRLLSWRYLWMDPYFRYRFYMNRRICDP